METEPIWRIEVKMRRKVFGDIHALELVRRVGQEVKRQDGDGQEVIWAGGVGKLQKLVEGEILVLEEILVLGGSGKILPLLIATRGEAPIIDM